MSEATPAVVLMARAPRRGTVHRPLEAMLGSEGCMRLQSALLVRALAWAREVAGEHVHVAYEPADAREELEILLGESTEYLPQSGEGIASRTAGASGQIFAATQRPQLILWPTVPRLASEHASAAIADLRAGGDVVLGPVYDGGLYLLGLARPAPALFALPERTWRSPELVTIALSALRAAGLEVGVLRAERPLQRPADVHAALVDPTLPVELHRVLSRAH